MAPTACLCDTGRVLVPPYHILGPTVPQRAVVIAVPHAGRYYPPSIIGDARVRFEALERLEDRYVDALVIAAAQAGFTVIVANYARAFVDLNRGEDEWDAELIADGDPTIRAAGRASAGLGVVPTRLHPEGRLWRRRLSRAELETRLAQVHRPWHDAVEALLRQARGGGGTSVLIDLHSMPRQLGGAPQFVIGDRHGGTASVELVDRLLATAEGQGLAVARNSPFAGAHSVDRHGRRAGATEAVQIEIDRSLYLGEGGRADDAAVTMMSALVRACAEEAERWATGRDGFAIAAE